MSSASRGRDTAVLLLRHAATSWNEQHRRVGWTDAALSSAGRRAAGEWAERGDPRLEIVCCSDLRRARDTAALIARTLRLGEVCEVPGLREQDQGAWTGLTKDQIKQRWPQRARERPRRPVGGESPEAVLARALEALHGIALRHPGRRILAVTHSGLIRTLERAMSVPAPPVPHLQGRWITLSRASRDRPERLRAGRLTAGRDGAARESAAGAAAGRR